MMMFLTILLIVSAVFLVIVILMQQGKGQEMGAVFGGSSQTIFGASGAGNFLTKATAVIAIIFMASAFFISYISAQKEKGIPIPKYASGKASKQSLPLAVKSGKKSSASTKSNAK
jgi:preprotein translocase subunit SecG